MSKQLRLLARWHLGEAGRRWHGTGRQGEREFSKLTITLVWSQTRRFTLDMDKDVCVRERREMRMETCMHAYLLSPSTSLPCSPIVLHWCKIARQNCRGVDWSPTRWLGVACMLVDSLDERVILIARLWLASYHNGAFKGLAMNRSQPRWLYTLGLSLKKSKLNLIKFSYQLRRSKVEREEHKVASFLLSPWQCPQVWLD